MGGEWIFAEKPVIDALKVTGYTYLDPIKHDENRDAQNHVIFKPFFIEAIKRINGISDTDAQAVYQELVLKSDNEEWTNILRGNYSRTVEGKATS